MSLDLLRDPLTGGVIPPPRIVDGYEVSPAFKYPTMVSLQYLGRHNCGGVLWDANTVITAAHCSGGNMSYDTVLVHRHNFTKSTAEEQGKVYSVTKKTPHPDFDRNTFANDVAVWKLNNTDTTRTNVELDNGTYSQLDTLLTAIGWGRTVEGGAYSKVLMEVKLPVLDDDKCVADYKEYNNDLDKTVQLCAGFPEGGKDACKGDSGGPLFTVKNGKFHLVGITSYGLGCARPKLPGIYTRVSQLKEWILENI